MHVAFDIKAKNFEVWQGGDPSTRDALLQWEKHDRIGIVVDRPFGALDALLMLMLAGTAFYDADPKRRKRPLYPDAFVFHLGGPWGTFMAMDFVPDHKEVMVAPDPQEMLRAINHAGITHLLVPEREPRTTKHRFKEPEAALDRIKSAFVYGPLGDARHSDITISAPSFEPFAQTVSNVLNPEPFLQFAENMMANPAKAGHTAGLRVGEFDEFAHLVPLLRRRQNEVSVDDPERLRHLARLASARQDDRLHEAYRRIEVRTSLDMLYPD